MTAFSSMEPVDPLAHRRHAARLANRAREVGNGDSWFEPMYQWAAGDEKQIPWADLEPHPLLVEASRYQNYGTVAVVGCGLGDDAEFMASRSQSVWAFDLSPTAIEWAKKRFPTSVVSYDVANLFELPSRTFDLVVEIYTLQALPPESRPQAIRALAKMVAPGGEILVVTRWRSPEMELGAVPWPLLKSEWSLFKDCGLQVVYQSDAAPGEPIRLHFARPSTLEDPKAI